jgi:competence protein ComEA
VRSPSRRSDDADLIRARLRALLAERGRPGGWVPDDLSEVADRDVDDPDGPDGLDDLADPQNRDEPAWPPSADEHDRPLPAGVGRHRSPGATARWSPGNGGARALWLAGLGAAVLLIGWTWIDRPQVEPVPAAPTPSAASTAPAAPSVGVAAETSTTVVVSVVGLVARPGLVTLPSGSRVADAVTAAGGLLPEADPASVNLAAVVSDGQQIAVGIPGAPGGPSPAPAGSGNPAGPVNLNSATAAELDALPGIGPVLAQRIVEHREQNGPFRSVDELDDVPGIGPAIAADLAGRVTV